MINDFRIDQLFEDEESGALHTAGTGELNGEMDIAVVGMSVRMPGASSLQQFWELIQSGADCVGPIPLNRKKDVEDILEHSGKPIDGLVYEEGGYLERIDDFDYSLFNLSPNEANLMDPNQRLFLQTAWACIEDAGYGGHALNGSNTGVFVGFGNESEYKRIIEEGYPDLASMAVAGNIQPFIGSRISYLLDWKGPSMLINTTCSSSLVAVHMACQSICRGESDQAVAGGVKINILPVRNTWIGVEATDGRTRSFDENAEGTGMGEGVAAVMLKPLHCAVRDKDSIYAVIKGSAINQTGSSIGLTAPNSESQKDVIVRAWEAAGIDPLSIRYWEAHGTGTRLGDPIEIEAISKAYESRYIMNRQFCALGSIKANLGHLDNAAGIAGLVKAVLTVKYGKLPPLTHFQYPNRQIQFSDTPLYVNTELADWKPDIYPRRCAVSSFGITGTNCHIILEEAPAGKADELASQGQAAVFTLSALIPSALSEAVRSWREAIRSNADWRAICYISNCGRGHYSNRVAFIVRSHKELEDKLELLEERLEADVSRGIYITLTDENERSPHKSSVKESNGLEYPLQDYYHQNELACLEQLCQSYVEGLTIAWENLHKGKERQKLHLPAYPFQKHRCWLPDPGISEQSIRLLAPIWKEAGIPLARPLNVPSMDGGAVLVFKDRMGKSQAVIDHFRSLKYLVVEIEDTGEGFEQTGELRFKTGTEEDAYQLLCKCLEHLNIIRIIYMSALAGTDERSDSAHTQRLARSTGNFFYFTKHFMKRRFNNPIDVTLISNYCYEITGDEPDLLPENAALYGLGKTIRLESPLHCRCIDIDDDVTTEQILHELACPFDSYTVAYRKGCKYVESWKEVEPASDPQQQLELDSRGIYVVAGGSGGIALELISDWAEEMPASYALISSTGFPERTAWPAFGKEQADSVLARRVEACRQIESKGSRLFFYTTDISDSNALDVTLNQIRTEHGPIKGVVHSAGRGGGGYIFNKSAEEFWRVMAPKVSGTRNLHTLTSQDPLSFFVLFSSVTTISGGLGQGDYTAANHYQDVFADYRHRTHPNQITLCINWSAWENTGMAGQHKHDRSRDIFTALPVARAVKAFRQAFRQPHRRVAIGTIRENGHIYGLTPDSLGIGLSTELRSQLDQEKKRPLQAAAKTQIMGTQEKHLQQIEEQIGQVWADVLGYSRFHIDDNFFEIGGNSIYITRVYEKLLPHYPGVLSMADLFAYPTLAKLADYIYAQAEITREVIPYSDDIKGEQSIAIIGLSGVFPYAENADEFWENIDQQMDCIRMFPEGRISDSTPFQWLTANTGTEKSYVEGGYLNRVDAFDHRYFRISHKEASLMDPNQRIFLQQAWKAIEDAGYGGDSIRGSKTGVFVGYIGLPVYGQIVSLLEPESAPLALAGNVTSIIASRIAYLLDLKGPSMVIDTACSSSLVAIHRACLSLRNGECEQAIAGSVKIIPLPVADISGVGIESSDYKTRTFDDASDGTVWGEGSAAFVLKPLSTAVRDGDRIYAVIKGGAVNQDGSSSGITAPNPLAQEQLLVDAWKDARIPPESISYIEAHGTGTRLGDPIEISAITKAFERFTDKKQFCAIGSVKTNIGHLDHCSGAAGLLKAVMALQHRTIPATLNFQKPNQNIDFGNSPVFVADKSMPWIADAPLRCGVSSFGLSGTNCHLVLEEAPVQKSTVLKPAGQLELCTISAASAEAFTALVKDCVYELRYGSSVDLRQISYTLNSGRGHYSHRAAMVVSSIGELIRILEQFLIRGAFHRPEEGIFYRGELSREQLKQVPECPHPGDDRELLMRFGEYYVDGGRIDWSQWYEADPPAKIKWPVYPFANTRCWFEINRIVSLPWLTLKEENSSANLQPADLPDKEAGNTRARLAKIWNDILGIEKINTSGHFFDLGGDSLSIMVLSSKINKEFGCHLPASLLFEEPEFMKQAVLIEEQSCIQEKDNRRIGSSKRSAYPLTPSQLNVYIHQVISENKTLYNETHSYRVIGRLDSSRLESAFQSLIRRHGSLRTSFDIREGEIVQLVHEDAVFKLDSKTIGKSQIHAAVNEFIQPFDLKQAPLLRACLLEVEGEEEQILLFDTHHINVDGKSMEIMAAEIRQLYGGASLPPLQVQFSDYTVWFNEEYLHSEEFRKQRAYWLKEYQSRSAPMVFPFKRWENEEGGAVASVYASKKFEVNSTLIRTAASDTNATSFILAVAILNIVLAKICQTDDITIGYPVLGRPVEEVQSLIGMFTNMIGIRNYLSPELNFNEFVDRVRQKVGSSLDHQEYPLQLVMDELAETPSSRRDPLFNTVIVYEVYEEEKGRFQHDEIQLALMDNDHRSMRFDLLLHVVQVIDGWRCSFLYNPAKFEDGDAELLGAEYISVLKKVSAACGTTIGQLTGLSRMDHISGREKVENEISVEFEW